MSRSSSHDRPTSSSHDHSMTSSSRDRSTTSSSTTEGQHRARRNRDDHGALERAAPRLAKPLRVASFWAAIVLPLFYLPLLVIGLSSLLTSGAFLGLLAINLVAFYLGHSHRR